MTILLTDGDKTHRQILRTTLASTSLLLAACTPTVVRATNHHYLKGMGVLGFLIGILLAVEGIYDKHQEDKDWGGHQTLYGVLAFLFLALAVLVTRDSTGKKVKTFVSTTIVGMATYITLLWT